MKVISYVLLVILKSQEVLLQISSYRDWFMILMKSSSVCVQHQQGLVYLHGGEGGGGGERGVILDGELTVL